MYIMSRVSIIIYTGIYFAGGDENKNQFKVPYNKELEWKGNKVESIFTPRLVNAYDYTFKTLISEISFEENESRIEGRNLILNPAANPQFKLNPTLTLDVEIVSKMERPLMNIYAEDEEFREYTCDMKVVKKTIPNSNLTFKIIFAKSSENKVREFIMNNEVNQAGQKITLQNVKLFNFDATIDSLLINDFAFNATADTDTDTNNPPSPPPPETIHKIDLEFKVVDLREHQGGHFTLALENLLNLTEQTGNPRYRFVIIRPKNDADKNNLKVNNKIKIKEIEIGSKKTQVRSECLDVLGFYKTIDLIEAGQTTPNQNNNTPPWISAFDIIFEATLNDNQIRNFLTTSGISSEEFMNRLMEWGNEETLINRPANALKYDEIKKFLGIDSQTPPNNNPPNNDNPSPNQSPNNPPKPNTPNTPKPTPTQENSQKSEENIKDINNSSSVEQARTKTQTEINSLLERYGVKAEQLSTSLWENEASWEAYLNKLSAVDQVSQFIKRMKVAIMQQDKHNQKANQQLSVTQLKTNIKQNIKTLLKKYPQVKTDSNSILKDWEVALERENDKTKLTNLERQFREAIIASTNQKQTTADSQKSNLATKLLIGGSVILVLTGAAFSVVIIRNKRLKRIKKNS
ncbi:MAG: hypothetical protein MRERC_14c010 [Mycoplasmataceae bacterium RC_NB112A]|nr:MAG: hypothetical protein MRERC_14c010 [Mycoplasmataceae bacterium RC_NB112A]